MTAPVRSRAPDVLGALGRFDAGLRAGDPHAHRIVRSTIAVLLIAFNVLFILPRLGAPGFDAQAYWGVDPFDPYVNWNLQYNNFRYSPAFADVFAPFGLLPWPVFLAGWIAFNFVLVVWMARGWSLYALAFTPVFIELHGGNVHLLTAAAIVLGFRFPAAWAIVLLSKATPGVGLLWYVVRREWRPLMVALGATAAIAGASFVFYPPAWFEWISLLGTGARGVSLIGPDIPLWLRLPVAAAIVSWGALTDRKWVVPVAAMIAMPVFWPLVAPSMLVACLPLLRQDRAERASAEVDRATATTQAT